MAVSFTGSDPTYRPQLDGLRAVAVTAVAWSHWERGLQFGIPFGAGVHLFYVLSGFLITGILLRLRAAPSPARVLSAFYARRALRIVPAFYVTLTIAALAGIPTVRDSLAWHAAYLSNVWIFVRGQWPGDVSHFWSLAVEEQFYLVWPFVILFAPSRWLGPAIVMAIAISPLFRWGLVIAGYRETLQALLTPGCLDSLGMGALLAWVGMAKPDRYPSFTRALLRVGLPGWLGCLLARATSAQLPAPVAALEQVFQACVFAWPVARAAAGFRGWLGRVLESSPVTYLGRISYGVYLAHGFAGVIVAGVLATLGLRDVLLPEPLRFVALASVTIVTAALAWHFIEAPILAVKARVSYRTAPTPRPRSGGSEDPALPLGVSVEAGL